jgi:hypothetical protein
MVKEYRRGDFVERHSKRIQFAGQLLKKLSTSNELVALGPIAKADYGADVVGSRRTRD